MGFEPMLLYTQSQTMPIKSTLMPSARKGQYQRWLSPALVCFWWTLRESNPPTPPKTTLKLAPESGFEPPKSLELFCSTCKSDSTKIRLPKNDRGGDRGNRTRLDKNLARILRNPLLSPYAYDVVNYTRRINLDQSFTNRFD